MTTDDKLTISAFPDAALHARRERGKAYAAQRAQAQRAYTEALAPSGYTARNDPRQLRLFDRFNADWHHAEPLGKQETDT
jgi:hypothetical protein